MLAARFPTVADQLVDAEVDLLAYADFPRSHWRRIWSTNPPGTRERRDQAARQRRRDLPNDTAVIRLVGAVLLEVHDEWQVTDRAYLSEHSMAQLHTISDQDPTKEVPTDPAHALPAA